MRFCGHCVLALWAAWPAASVSRGALDAARRAGHTDRGRGLASEMEAYFSRMYDLERQDLGLEMVLRDRGDAKARRTVRHKPFFWVHIHKAAGTTMCRLAQKNDERIIRPGGPLMANCNWFPHDINHKWMRAGFPRAHEAMNCQARHRHWRRRRFSWAQIERPFSAPMFCPEEFGYGVALRDPVKLAESMINYKDPLEPAHARGNSTDAILQCVVGAEGATADGCADSWGGAEDSVWMFFDNPMIRTLGGPEVMSLPFRGVNSTHADQVLDLVVKFDLVLIVEELGSNATQSMLRESLGWSAATLRKTMNPSKKHRNLTDAERAAVSSINRHDYRLYNHFKDARSLES